MDQSITAHSRQVKQRGKLRLSWSLSVGQHLTSSASWLSGPTNFPDTIMLFIPLTRGYRSNSHYWSTYKGPEFPDLSLRDRILMSTRPESDTKWEPSPKFLSPRPRLTPNGPNPHYLTCAVPPLSIQQYSPSSARPGH
ncbi:hypothetical protein RRG08_058689 [Elysia crispata]|uniref:Uncharacterized protein n=1 Tax=Elysia crispata TaxID=231223 RepID=A0AAE0YW69_9GAST|nr:hypothetical protein RRG08_058689 [Elysia crispata]